MKLKVSDKHLQIDKAQSIVAGIIAAATVITAISLVSSKALLSQAAFQRRVLNQKNEAVTKLDKNISTAHTVVDQYNNVFLGDSPSNVIGGKNTSDSNAKAPDGDNARIVLDALPTTYDFPALLTSMTAILSSQAAQNQSITGTDKTNEIDNKPTVNPEPQTITLEVTASLPYDKVQKVVADLERSIRPFDLVKFSMGGNQDAMSIQYSANTYFQPAKSLTISTKEVK